jgi:hypothetical protein
VSTNETGALTAHLVRPGGHDDAFLHGVCEGPHRFNIHHATLQVEASGVCKAGAGACGGRVVVVYAIPANCIATPAARPCQYPEYADVEPEDQVTRMVASTTAHVQVSTSPA